MYNTSKYLDKCLESLLCQKGADFEIVLIDDGSTDDSGKICDDYAENYPNTVRVIHKENEGLLLTRRRGFREADGDWFICIDSDDYADNRLLESVVSVFDNYHPDMVMYNFSYVNDDGEVSQSRLDIPDRSVFSEKNKKCIYEKRLLTDDINNMWSKALKREIVDIEFDYFDCGISNMCEDAIQVLPLFTNAEKIVYLSEPLYFYRKGQDTITANRSYENWISIKKCFFITEKYLDIWAASDELKYKFYTHNTEILSNFLRWYFCQSESELPKTYEDVLRDISNSTGFRRCIKNYNKKYAQTFFLKYSVPRIMSYVKKRNVNGLKKYFSRERKLLLLAH